MKLCGTHIRTHAPIFIFTHILISPSPTPFPLYTHIHSHIHTHIQYNVQHTHTQLRAPGCPVIIVGTHLDAVTTQVAKDLEEEAKRKYSNATIYPKVRVQPSIPVIQNEFL